MSQIGQLSEDSIEQEIKNRGLDYPRLTPQHIDATIADEHYWVAPGTTTTVCVLVLLNGYTTVGESACVDPRNFDEAIGRKVARDKARDKIWALEGYLLKEGINDSLLLDDEVDG